MNTTYLFSKIRKATKEGEWTLRVSLQWGMGRDAGSRKEIRYLGVSGNHKRGSYRERKRISEQGTKNS